ncbi:Bardet-Biedl syndrome 10 protein homolog isoform X2 [Dreissena polymorpha]|uniref:Uncharacterized protein n=3 Tax=Dreissena polymorpha TaxID=45954 RepID=A0A9D4E4Z0_DREPO|nr:Bardet-Biedl syndrome 10 protein homolog isoform X2 [Dreissena polymorpha]XP_052229585.1 Bardet-Biedl syndrome 10 protein homolog isoform X2 [Dreissena polymorpha]XP_052229586.1 Bardet-Biedl syndrome 10 protein homolog isoform X2 [Dreissena polymorpha]XP_052229587.1 Bardet-Biedl syndrome 10 protein homolog isoform X2 [Dreissena polymorpha]XP_052229588.1 Bardet-Biedl syndrome 10 protein homolog isoform X2 [Dreissena polymorpha]XP_052229589.1 Bardet-Biedl syndrome 10 protein homolog isoform X
MTSSQVDLHLILQVVSSLRKVVASGYGPQCAHTLLTSQTGKAVVTSDGLTIIEALNVAHPLAQVIVKAIQSCMRQTQDGAKTFLLLLDNLIINIGHHIAKGCFSHSGLCSLSQPRVLQNGMLCARKAIGEFENDILPIIKSAVYKRCLDFREEVLQQIGMSEVLKRVCNATIMPHYSGRVSNFMSDLLVMSVLGGQEAVSYSNIRFVSQYFQKLVVKVPNRGYSECTTVEPLLIRNKVKVAVSGINILVEKEIKALVLMSGVDLTTASGDLNRETINIKHGTLTSLLLHRRKSVQSFAGTCQRLKISLLLCSETVPNYAGEIFEKHGISVIAFVESDDIELLEMLTKKLALSSIYDEISDINVIELQKVSEMTIGGENYTQLLVPGLINWKHLIVCAPTVGLVDQATIVFSKALHALNMCFVDINTLNYDAEHESVNERATNPANHNLAENDVGITKSEDDECVTELDNVEKSANFSKGDCFGKKILANDVEGDKLGDNSSVILFIQGGGTFEVLMSVILQRLVSKCTDVNTAEVCKAMSDMFKDCVHTLHDCTAKQGHDTRRLNEIWSKLQKEQSCGLSRRGNPIDWTNSPVFEPIASKMHVFECVVGLIKQLLGLDGIVSVKKIYTKES